MTEGKTIEDPVAEKRKQFVSFSANAEDVILHRLFGSRPSGFYVDVGAAHPTFENDTRALYDQGWHGINIEPNPVFFAELVVQRERDLNLQVAVSDQPGTLTYWNVLGTGLSTCDHEESVRARDKGFKLEETIVSCTTLAAVLENANRGNIDLLKVDVEGFELRVLRGNDWTRFRPSVILVEATYPETPHRRPDHVRPYLEQNGYRFAYFDGLNDFFVEHNFPTPENAFLPPNVFDHFVPRALADLQEHVSNLERNRKVQEDYVKSLQEHVERYRAERAAGKYTNSGDAREADTRGTRLQDEINLLSLQEARSRKEASQAIETTRVLGEELLALRRDIERAAAKAGVEPAAFLRGAADHCYESDNARQVPDEVRARIGEIEGNAQKLRIMLEAMYASTSWQVTAPLRFAARLLGRR